MKSVKRIITESMMPPKNPATAPVTVPINAESPPITIMIINEISDPLITSEK